MDIRGGVTIITGSADGRGGGGSAKLLAQKGCNVVINYTKSEAEAKETQSDCEALGVDTLPLPGRRLERRRLQAHGRGSHGYAGAASTA